MSYTYDDDDNILTVAESETQQTQYIYDSDHQLVRENSVSENKTVSYSYDDNGNILSVTEYAYTLDEDLSLHTPTDTITYTYGDIDNPDRLTGYDGNTVTYTEDGEMRLYDDKVYTWNDGRLVGVTDTVESMAAAYTYNLNDIRASKVINGQTATYTLDGNMIDSETIGFDNIDYVYDSNDSPVYMTLNGTPYYYQKNLQGDIIGIVDSSNTEVVTYTYDAWGELLSVSGTLASTVGEFNRLRYRGYYYDTESGMYYLQSRYYDPELGRFISKDDPIYHEGETGAAANLYAYCENNPVNMVDPMGNEWAHINTFLKSMKSFIPGTQWTCIKTRNAYNYTIGISWTKDSIFKARMSFDVLYPKSMYMDRYTFYKRMGMPAIKRTQIVKVTKRGYWMQVIAASAVSFALTRNFKVPLIEAAAGMFVGETINPHIVGPGEYKVIQTVTYAKTSNKDTYAVIVTLEAYKKEKDAKNNTVWIKYHDKGVKNTFCLGPVTWQGLKRIVNGRLYMW